MPNHPRAARAVFAGLLLALAPSLFAQETGTVTGRVFDAETGAALPGAVVTVPAAQLRSVTSLTGDFALAGVPAGAVELRVDYLGYPSATSSLTLAAGATAAVEVGLGGDDVVELAEYRVAASQTGLVRALNQERTSQNQLNILSADVTGELPYSTVADAVAILPGVNVEQTQRAGEGRYVTIRGMNADFNAVSVNGQRFTIANFDGASRSTPLDVVSATAASQIEVTKAVTPDMDGDGVGGAVNIRTRSAFDHQGRYGRVEASVGLNELADKYTGDYPFDGTPYEFSAEYSDYLNGAKNLGLAVSLNYRDRPILIESLETIAPFGLTEGPDVPAAVQNKYMPGGLRLEEAYDNVQNTGATLSLDYRPSDALKLSAYLNYSLRELHYGSNRAEAIYFPELVYDDADFAASGDTLTQFDTNDRLRRQVRDFYETQELVNFNLSGEHAVGTDLTLTWGAGVSTGSFEGDPQDTSARFRSGFRDSSFGFDVGNAYSPRYSSNIVTTAASSYSLEFLERGTRFIEDTDAAADVALRGDFEFGGRSAFWKAGLKVTSREREFDDVIVRYRGVFDAVWTLDSLTLFGEQLYGSVLADYGVDETINGGSLGYLIDPAKVRAAETALLAAGQRDEGDPLYYFNRNVERDRRQGLVGTYDAEEQVAAAFAMAQVQLQDNFSLLFGLRAEQTDVSFQGHEGDFFETDSSSPFFVRPVSQDHDYANVMPHLHARWDFTKDFLLRLSVNQTLARPSYRQLNPSADIDTDAEVIFAGRTDLDPTLSTNFDLSADYAFGSFGRVALSLFHKNMESNVYRFNTTVAANDPRYGAEYAGYELREFRNAEGAQVTGYEFAYNLPLDVFTGALRGLDFYGNYTHTESSVDGIIGRADGSTPLFGQVPDTVNLGLAFERWNFRTRLSYRWTEAYLDFNGINDDPKLDVYVDARETVDWTFGYRLPHGFDIFAEIRNLTDSEARAYRGDNGLRFAYREGSGRFFNFGVSWTY